MSPIWIPWFAFWAGVILVITRIFQGVARKDRISKLRMDLNLWSTGDVVYFIERLQHRKMMSESAVDTLTSHPLMSLAAIGVLG